MLSRVPDKVPLLPTSSSDRRLSTSLSSSVIQLSVSTLAAFTLSLPLFGFFFCVLYSFLYNFESSTYTHCDVPNFAPSISAAIGSFFPQKYVWQGCVALHSAPRFLFAVLTVKHLERRLPQRRPSSRLTLLLRLAVTLHVCENLSLVILSIVPSKENFPLHKFGFGSFVFCSFAFMSIVVWFVSQGGHVAQNLMERRSVLYKQRLYKLTSIVLLLMLYFYWRHNQYCEPYVYTFFCVAEYLVVLANMGFHMTAYYDFYDSQITVSASSFVMEYQKIDPDSQLGV